VAAGEAFSPEQRARIDHAIASAESVTGLRFALRIGELDPEPRLEGERLLAHIAANPRDGVVLILVSPGDRRVEIVSTPAARRRLPDHAAGLAVLSMTSSFGVGDLVGGVVTGVRQLADAAGPPAVTESSVEGEVLPRA
jgi:hypothetical protein